jgi:hypothetical protein
MREAVFGWPFRPIAACVQGTGLWTVNRGICREKSWQRRDFRAFTRFPQVLRASATLEGRCARPHRPPAAPGFESCASEDWRAAELRAASSGPPRASFVFPQPFPCGPLCQRRAEIQTPNRSLAQSASICQKPRHSPACCGSSVVEHIIGNDEVGSSILPRSTSPVSCTHWIY